MALHKPFTKLHHILAFPHVFGDWASWNVSESRGTQCSVMCNSDPWCVLRGSATLSRWATFLCVCPPPEVQPSCLCPGSGGRERVRVAAGARASSLTAGTSCPRKLPLASHWPKQNYSLMATNNKEVSKCNFNF